MSILVNFDGKQILEPGSYSTIKAGFSPATAISTYGDVVIVDTGSGRGYGFGGGINGEFTNGANAVYEYATAADAKKALRGGLLYDLMDFLWVPGKDSRGPRRVFITKAATTTAPRLKLQFSSVVTNVNTVVVPETRATLSFTFTGYLEGQRVWLYASEPGNWYQILNYTTPTGSNLTTVATKVAEAIGKSHTGYTATSSVVDGVATITISARPGIGASANGAELYWSYNGDSPLTSVQVDGTFGGGVTGYSYNTYDTTGNDAPITLAARNEGDAGNGLLVNDVLTRGYGVKLRTGIMDSTKFFLEFYEGQYRGADDSGVDYELRETDVKNKMLFRSAEVSTTGELLEWMDSNTLFKSYFVVTERSMLSVAIPVNNLLLLGTSILPFAGGTTTYQASDIDKALEVCEEMENSMFLCDDYGFLNIAPSALHVSVGTNKGAISAANAKILAHILTNATYSDKIMFIGGGKDNSQFLPTGDNTGSCDVAAYYDSESVVLVHSDIYFGTRRLPALYHAAMVCGLTAGKEPQVPVTNKALRITGVEHVLTKAEREKALTFGVLHERKIGTQWVINEGVNTLQKPKNGVFYNEDGTSFRITTKRIKHQLNKELVINASARFPGNNVNSVDAEDVKLFTEKYLLDRTATKEKDNLIVNYRNVVPRFENGAWVTTYCFTENAEIAKTFHTGYLLDPNVELN